VLTKRREAGQKVGMSLHFKMGNEAPRDEIMGSLVADMQQKPHRKHLANSMRPCTYLPLVISSQALHKTKHCYSSLLHAPPRKDICYNQP